MITMIKKGGRFNAQIEEWEIENVSEMSQLPADTPVGSIATDISTGKTYKLYSTGEWNEYTAPGGGSGGGSSTNTITSKGTLQSGSFNDVEDENVTYALSALQTYTDGPEPSPFAGVLMQTIYNPGSSRCQIVYMESGKIYTRIYASSTWRSWRTADGPDAMFVTGTYVVNNDAGQVTIQTQLSDIVSAYLEGRVVFLEIDVGEGSMLYIRLRNAHDTDGHITATFEQESYTDGEISVLMVEFEDTLTAEIQTLSYSSGGGSSALICEGTLDDQTGEYTLETPLADIVEAYQAGRDVLLPMQISDTGAGEPPTYYIPAHAAISVGGVCIVTFLGVFHAEGETQYTRVAFTGEQTAEGEIETVYDGPLDVAFAVDMTQSPPTVSTTAETTSYSNVTAAVNAGRVVRAKISLGTVGANTEGYIYAPLQQYFRDTSNDSISELRFSEVCLIDQATVEHIEIRWSGSTPGIIPTPLTS